MDSLLQWCIENLRDNMVLLLFLLLGVGYLIGNVRIGGFSLGPVAGVLFAGIFFGHFGLRIPPGGQAVGFALFIFSVGYQAGPRFFSAIREDGLRYFALCLIVTITAVSITVLAASLLDLDPGVPAGLLSGGLTSSPTLAAAQNAVRDGTIPLAEGWTQEAVLGNIASAYAITYIFGLTGLITVIRYMPKLLGIDMVEESRRQEELHGASVSAPLITTRCYRVSNPVFTQLTLEELRARYCERAPVGKVFRDGEQVSTAPEDRLRPGDRLELSGPRELFTSGIHEIGPEITPAGDLLQNEETARIIVTSRQLFNRTLEELHIPQTFGLLVLHVTRTGVEIPHSPGLKVQKGDILSVIGPAEGIDRLGAYAGQVERDISEADMVTFSFGIVAGVLLGMLSVTLGGIALGLGSAGGLLASGLLIGYLRSIRPTFGRLPEPARWMLMELGLLLFMAGVGLQAGGSIFDTLKQSGPMLVLAGIVVTTVPIAVAYLFGSRVLKLNPAILMGALTGAMTSGAALSVVTKEAASPVPSIGYAGTYAFGNVLLMVAGPLVLLFT